MFQCSLCSFSSQTDAEASQHFQTAHGFLANHCLKCLKEFENDVKLKKHSENCKNDILAIECPLECDQSISSVAALIHHLEHVHHNVFWYCSFCKDNDKAAKFLNFQQLEQHCSENHQELFATYLSNHPDRKKVFENQLQLTTSSSTTSSSSSSSPALKRKSSSSHNNATPPLKKPSQKKQKSSKNLSKPAKKPIIDLKNNNIEKNWTQSIVENKKVYQCKKCDKQFTSIQGITRHVEIIHQHLRHQCWLCDKSFKYKNAAKYHVEKSHPKQKFSSKNLIQIFVVQD